MAQIDFWLPFPPGSLLSKQLLQNPAPHSPFMPGKQQLAQESLSKAELKEGCKDWDGWEREAEGHPLCSQLRSQLLDQQHWCGAGCTQRSPKQLEVSMCEYVPP